MYFKILLSTYLIVQSMTIHALTDSDFDDTSMLLSGAKIVTEGNDGNLVVAVTDETNRLIQAIEMEIGDGTYRFSVLSQVYSDIYTELNLHRINEESDGYYIETAAYIPDVGWSIREFYLVRDQSSSAGCDSEESSWKIIPKVIQNQKSLVEPHLSYDMVIDSGAELTLEAIELLNAHFSLAEAVLGDRRISADLPIPFRTSILSRKPKGDLEGQLESGSCEITDSTIVAAGCTGSCFLFAACLWAGCGGVVGCAGCAGAGLTCGACLHEATGCFPGDGSGGGGGW